MTTDRTNPMTCDEFDAHLDDMLDIGVQPAVRDRMDAHRLDCAECDALAADFIRIKAEAAKLPLLTPSHDLWAGIESRIGAEVIELPVHTGEMEVAAGDVYESPAALVAPVSPLAAGAWLGARSARSVAPWRALAAATVLVAVTSAITWTVANRAAGRPADIAAVQPDSGFEVAMAATRNVRLTSGRTLEETYDGEIATLRRLVDERRADIDSVTLAVVERNLLIIDQAIAESKMALAQSPNSAFLLERLTDAYDSKLRTLRAVASIQPRG